MLAITLGYGFIYTFRPGLSIVRKPLIDGGIFSVEEPGMIVESKRYYDFDTAILFWIGSSVDSMLLAATLWNAKVRD